MDGLSIAYREQGDGPPLVLLHGWPLDSREWWRQLRDLSTDFRVVAWDAPGAGSSSDPPAHARMPDWADWLAGFMDALALESAHVAGLSFGGGLALEFFRRHPNRVRSLILLSAYAGWGGSLPADEVAARLALIRRNVTLPPEEWVPALIDTLLPEGSDAALVEELTQMLSEAHPAATPIALEAFADSDLRESLGNVDVPTLMVYGELDVRSPRAVWEPIHTAIAGAEIVVIPGVGHMVDMQAPERCNSEIRAFLQRAESMPKHLPGY